MLALLFAAVTAFTPIPSPDALLSGHFLSCPEGETYGERAFQYQQHGTVLFELHMGPRDEFALFKGEFDGDADHAGRLNLLTPAFHYDDVQSRTGRNWSAYGLHVNVVRVPVSDEDCYGFLVRVVADKGFRYASR